MTLNNNKIVEDELRALLNKLSAGRRHHLNELKKLEALISEAETALLKLTINNNSSSPLPVADLFTKHPKKSMPNPYQSKPSAPKKLPPDVTHIDTFVTKYIHKTAGFELYHSELPLYKLAFINGIPSIGTVVMIGNEYKAKDGFQQHKHLGVITKYYDKEKSRVWVRLYGSKEYIKSVKSLRVITHNFFRIPQRFIDEVV